MLPKFNSSFPDSGVPVDNVQGGGQSFPDENKIKIQFQLLISIIIFVGVVGSSIAIFGINYYFDNQIELVKSDIVLQQESFKINSIQELDAFEKQVNAYKEIISKRGVHRYLIDKSAELVAIGATYDSLSIEQKESILNIRIEGVSSSFRNFLNQARAFSNEEHLLANDSKVNLRIIQDENKQEVAFTFEKQIEIEKVLNNINNTNKEDI